MKAIALVMTTALLAATAASPAFAGGRSGGGLLTGVIGGVTGVVGGVANVTNTLNGVRVLNNSPILNGTTVAVPVSVNLSRNNILTRGLLSGGGGHGCGCN